ncbi:FadR family transcriptional regulator [Paeniglutamicibacter sp. ZC-3]|uniref:FadR/GntR family transcriptional regulator n=1 Tax=Paeniglutamicibacter sp. ZC-3 TaxID=2986919 RepID=UPI0021F7AE33|nr:FadR/GntR family transcriptional regulator [Paeniglutamicibacter sp. ZC-3]MCV9996604.1 FadR family transcriptional regulator [Paeniglutamicibacter sp. ZC-3]
MALTDKAILQVRTMILSGDWKPGDRLPPEAELSDQLGLSRGSLREAVKALSVVGVLEVRRGDGTFVAPLGSQMIHDALSFLTELYQGASATETLAVRRLLEVGAIRAAVSNVDQLMLTRLRAEMDSADTSSIEALVDHDTRFHALIAEASGNAYLASILGGMAIATQRVRVWRGLRESGAVGRTVNEHWGIYRAIESRDADLAASLLTVHISGVQDWLRSVAPE